MTRRPRRVFFSFSQSAMLTLKFDVAQCTVFRVTVVVTSLKDTGLHRVLLRVLKLRPCGCLVERRASCHSCVRRIPQLYASPAPRWPAKPSNCLLLLARPGFPGGGKFPKIGPTFGPTTDLEFVTHPVLRGCMSARVSEIDAQWRRQRSSTTP